MWKPPGGSLQSVLIVAKENGSVFIVENKKSESQVERILKTDAKKKKALRTQRKQPAIKFETREPSPIPVKSEIKIEPLEVLDDSENLNYESSYEVAPVTFIDPSAPLNDLKIKIESEIKIESYELPLHHQKESSLQVLSTTFDGHYTSSEDDCDDDNEDYHFDRDDSDDEPLVNPKAETRAKRSKVIKKSKKKKTPAVKDSQRKFQQRKSRSLVGKLACKYCDTIFESKDEKIQHVCEYLQCDRKNFICRICKKELSKKTFSNHLHETLDCQYCGKKFINPRNVTAHILNKHNNEDFIPPKKIKNEEIIKTEFAEETARSEFSKPKIAAKSKQEKKKLECDLCGKYLASLRSLMFHMGLHTGNTNYICESCGEKFYTPNGIRGHSCQKKRRRPETDYRTYDVRYCRFCDSHFANFDENKAHICPFVCLDNPKNVVCRCCSKVLPKLAFNRHMEIHSNEDHICEICNRKLATARALKTHLTTHTGNKPYRCSLCPQSFINKNVLDRHMRFHGASIPVFKCHVCFKQLSTETSLKSHIQRLHNPNVFCELCKMEFADRESLRNHFTSAHQPSVCQTCGKTFTLPRYLKAHEKLHFDDSTTKIACTICSKMLDIKNIKPHVFRHHPEQFHEWQHQNPQL